MMIPRPFQSRKLPLEPRNLELEQRLNVLVFQVVGTLIAGAILGGFGFAWRTNVAVTELREQGKAIAAQIVDLRSLVSRLSTADRR
jgi:hypothetical protein